MEKKNRTITFIYYDSVQKMVFEMIGQKAIEHGYEIKFTTNKFEKCDIGFYCEHINHPENSKFSIIMLHDITQQYLNWPDIWFREPWNKYDIGFLPSEKWKANWISSSDKFYTRPSRGCYVVGWPKADSFSSFDLNEKQAFFKTKFGLDPNKKTILYAPAWENDGKQDDFVKSMLSLDVNILIKQAPWVKKDYPKIVKNVEEMKELHENIPGVYILDTKTNIMEAICACDILVSEESSTMCEAVMLGKPAVSVSNWLIPDTNPKRFPSDTYEFAVKTKKENLTSTIEKMLLQYDSFVADAKKWSSIYFGDFKDTCESMMKILDEVLTTGKPTKDSLVPKKEIPISRKELSVFNKEQKRRIRIDTISKYATGRFFLKCVYKLKKIFKVK